MSSYVQGVAGGRNFLRRRKMSSYGGGMRHRSDIHGSVGTTGRGSTSVRNSEGVQIGHTWECRYDRTWFDFWVRERDQKLTHK